MSFKNLPSSLINSVVDILTQSNIDEQAIVSSVVADGLAAFGVSSIDDLKESDQKAFQSWAQKEIETRRSQKLVSEKGADSGEDAVCNCVEEEMASTGGVDIAENIAIGSDELAHNGAVGVRSTTKEPVHADVLTDTTVTEGKREYRLLVQFPTNERCVIVPPVTLPGAPTVEALKTVVEGLPYYSKVIEKALEAAMNPPHTQPQFSGDSAKAEK